MAIDQTAKERGLRLKQCRSAMRISQTDLARLTGWSEETPKGGLSASRIANFEQGTRRIGFEEASAFEAVFGVPAGYFMDVLDAKEAGAIAVFRGLVPKVRLDKTG